MNLDILGYILDEIKVQAELQAAIFADQPGKKPKYPYLTAKIIAEAKNEGLGAISKQLVLSEDANFDFDIEETKVEMPKITISINVFSKFMTEAYEKAQAVKKWFDYQSQEFLQDRNLVVVDTTSVENRDAFLIADYERKYGFDVIIRYTDTAIRRIKTIESYRFTRIGGE